MISPMMGRVNRHLQKPEKYQALDPELYVKLEDIYKGKDHLQIGYLDAIGLIPKARYYERIVPEPGAGSREAYWQGAQSVIQGSGLIFLDPNKGMEVPSYPKTRTDSINYVYFDEIARLLDHAPVLIYQHFPHEERSAYIQKRIKELKEKAGVEEVRVVKGGQVAFFLVSKTSLAEFDPVLKSVHQQLKGEGSLVEINSESVGQQSPTETKRSTEIYSLPGFLAGEVSVLEYKHWLKQKVRSLRKRDESRYPDFKVSNEDYKRKIHEAVVKSGGKDRYTGEALNWKLLSKWNNDKSVEHKGIYKREFALLPSVDHDLNEDGSISFHICAWRTNDCKNDLSYSELIEFCRKVLHHDKNK